VTTVAPPRTTGREIRISTTSLWWWTAIVTTAAAGAMHLAAAAGAVDSGNLAIGFFLLVALGQFAGATGLFLASRGVLRGTTALLFGGLVATAALIGLYLLVHRTGLLADLAGTGGAAADQSAHAGHAVDGSGAVSLGAPVPQQNAFDALGAVTLAVETVTTLALVALLPRRWRTRAVDSLCALGALTWLLWLTGVLG
jgi:hypothetical protein